jgi:DNA-directed RNA polymerase specialized sigma24 family protein
MPETTSGPNDTELVARYYGCDSSAFDELVGRWWKRLIGFFSGRGFSPEDAEDLALRTLVKLAATKERLDSPRFNLDRPLAPFLIKIAKNLSIQEWRNQRPPSCHLDECAELTDTATEAVPDPLMADLLLCVETLPEMEQTYILLCGKHGLGDMSHLEIGQLLGRWPAQVTELSQRTRARLRGYMKEKGYR